MIRFYDKEVFCMEFDSLSRSGLRTFFLKGNEKEIICILEQGRYAGYITWPSLLGNDDLEESIQKDYVILDEAVWENSRKYFSAHETFFGEKVCLPVLNKEGQLICFAYQDEEADRELRMLGELEKCEGALTFRDLNPEYEGVTIHGFNEAAYYMAEYLMGLEIPVRVEGDLWKEFEIGEDYEVLSYKNYEIWAEGVWQKSRDLWNECARSVSAEFECVDKIYEANIKAGKITDTEGDADWLLEKLKEEKEIVIIGTGPESQDAYDWLLGNDIDICAFLTKERVGEEKRLFGKLVLNKIEILRRFAHAVFIECDSRHSAWGFGGVDSYDCEGFKRNNRYFLLNDYIEERENSLRNILREKSILFVGNIDLCNRVWKWRKQCDAEAGRMGYWDILCEGGDEAGAAKGGMPIEKREDAGRYDIVVLVTPLYFGVEQLSEQTLEKHNEYIKKLQEYEICDYTEYFSYAAKLAGLEIREEITMKKELYPSGIVIGAIPYYSGNILTRTSLTGHPQIMLIQEYNYLNNNLYFICMYLAGKKSSELMEDFWRLYKIEAEDGAVERDFPNREKFIKKMEELLKLGDSFTSQELFVMFHIAYEAMYGRKILNLKDMIIYWEPHTWRRFELRRWSYWLHYSGLKGFILSTVRNRYARAGSAIRIRIGKAPIWQTLWDIEAGERTEPRSEWEERIIRFEDLKKKPREVLADFCKWVHIDFDEALMETTCHGSEASYKGISGFDLKPVYNLYEEYFTAFDRMRICLLNSAFHKKHGYPFVNPLNFSRRELQEMFLKGFRFDELVELDGRGLDLDFRLMLQHRIRIQLQKIRMVEMLEYA